MKGLSRWYLLLALLMGCTKAPELPPIGETGVSLPGKMVWRDLITPSPAAARDFYHGLLGWEFEPLGDSGYSVIRHEGVVIGGMVDANMIGTTVKSAVWLSAISVPDLKAAVRAAKQNGGRVMRGPDTLPRRGTVAVIVDAEGAVVQLVHSPTGDPVDDDPGMNRWLWTELMSGDPAGAAVFYEQVAGYTTEAGPDRADASYRLLMAGGKARAGIVENPFDATRAAWVPYVRVQDAGVASARAVELGGRLVVEPSPDLRGGAVALILDPSGAPVALQQWSVGMKEVQ
jgi:predicted enzyme related to lactoylglutathione lyase